MYRVIQCKTNLTSTTIDDQRWSTTINEQKTTSFSNFKYLFVYYYSHFKKGSNLNFRPFETFECQMWKLFWNDTSLRIDFIEWNGTLQILLRIRMQILLHIMHTICSNLLVAQCLCHFPYYAKSVSTTIALLLLEQCMHDLE